MPCYVCGRVQTDPARGASPWARGVVGREQVLICPACQTGDWADVLARCPRCDTTRLSIVLGSFVCRGCGHEWEVPSRAASSG